MRFSEYVDKTGIPLSEVARRAKVSRHTIERLYHKKPHNILATTMARILSVTDDYVTYKDILKDFEEIALAKGPRKKRTSKKQQQVQE